MRAPNMDHLRAMMIDIGNQSIAGEITHEEARAKLHTFQFSHGLSRRQMKNLMREQERQLKKKIFTIKQEREELNIDRQQIDRIQAVLKSLVDEDGPNTAAIRVVRETYPQIWAEVAGRTYKHVEGYGNYQLVYLQWALVTLVVRLREERPGPDPVDAGFEDMFANYQLHRQHNFPLFFVSPGICEAAWLSDLKFPVDWKTMHLPFEAFTLMLPKGNPMGHEALMVHRLVANGDVRLVVTQIRATGGSEHGAALRPDWPFEADPTDPKAETIRWVFNVIYAMAARPEYVERGARLSARKKKGDRERAEIWSPNIVGRKYAAKIAGPRVEDGEKKGVRRLHWRRGHFRQQPFGPRESPQYRVIWLEPMMVGGKT